MSRYFEIAALAVITLLVAVYGKFLLATMVHKPAAAIIVAGLLIAAVIGLRRTYLASDSDARIAITKSVAYIAAAVLALWNVLWPAKWIPGSCIAALVAAIVFDIITVAARKTAPEGT
jgi:hypothetical protein